MSDAGIFRIHDGVRVVRGEHAGRVGLVTERAFGFGPGAIASTYGVLLLPDGQVTQIVGDDLEIAVQTVTP